MQNKIRAQASPPQITVKEISKDSSVEMQHIVVNEHISPKKTTNNLNSDRKVNTDHKNDGKKVGLEVKDLQSYDLSNFSRPSSKQSNQSKKEAAEAVLAEYVGKIQIGSADLSKISKAQDTNMSQEENSEVIIPIQKQKTGSHGNYETDEKTVSRQVELIKNHHEKTQRTILQGSKDVLGVLKTNKNVLGDYAFEDTAVKQSVGGGGILSTTFKGSTENNPPTTVKNENKILQILMGDLGRHKLEQAAKSLLQEVKKNENLVESIRKDTGYDLIKGEESVKRAPVSLIFGPIFERKRTKFFSDKSNLTGAVPSKGAGLFEQTLLHSVMMKEPSQRTENDISGIRSMLHSTSFFKDDPQREFIPYDLTEMSKNVKLLTIEGGMPIYRASQVGDFFYFILEGTVAITYPMQDEKKNELGLNQTRGRNPLLGTMIRQASTDTAKTGKSRKSRKTNDKGVTGAILPANKMIADFAKIHNYKRELTLNQKGEFDEIKSVKSRKSRGAKSSLSRGSRRSRSRSKSNNPANKQLFMTQEKFDLVENEKKEENAHPIYKHVTTLTNMLGKLIDHKAQNEREFQREQNPLNRAINDVRVITDSESIHQEKLRQLQQLIQRQKEAKRLADLEKSQESLLQKPQTGSGANHSSSNPSIFGAFQKSLKRQGTLGKGNMKNEHGKSQQRLSVKKQTSSGGLNKLLNSNLAMQKTDRKLDFGDKFFQKRDGLQTQGVKREKSQGQNFQEAAIEILETVSQASHSKGGTPQKRNNLLPLEMGENRNKTNDSFKHAVDNLAKSSHGGSFNNVIANKTTESQKDPERESRGLLAQMETNSGRKFFKNPPNKTADSSDDGFNDSDDSDEDQSSSYARDSSFSLDELEVRRDRKGDIMEELIIKLKAGQYFGSHVMDFLEHDDKPTRIVSAYAASEQVFMLQISRESYRNTIRFYQNRIHQEKLQFLKNSDLMCKFARASLKKLADKLVFKEFQRHQFLFKEGMKAEKIYFVKTGEVRLSKRIIIAPIKNKQKVLDLHSNQKQNTESQKNLNQLRPLSKEKLGVINSTKDMQFKIKGPGKSQSDQNGKVHTIDLAIINQKGMLGEEDVIIKSEEGCYQTTASILSQKAQIFELDAREFIKEASKLHNYKEILEIIDKKRVTLTNRISLKNKIQQVVDNSGVSEKERRKIRQDELNQHADPKANIESFKTEKKFLKDLHKQLEAAREGFRTTDLDQQPQKVKPLNEYIDDDTLHYETVQTQADLNQKVTEFSTFLGHSQSAAVLGGTQRYNSTIDQTSSSEAQPASLLASIRADIFQQRDLSTQRGISKAKNAYTSLRYPQPILGQAHSERKQTFLNKSKSSGSFNLLPPLHQKINLKQDAFQQADQEYMKMSSVHHQRTQSVQNTDSNHNNHSLSHKLSTTQSREELGIRLNELTRILPNMLTYAYTKQVAFNTKFQRKQKMNYIKEPGLHADRMQLRSEVLESLQRPDIQKLVKIHKQGPNVTSEKIVNANAEANSKLMKLKHTSKVLAQNDGVRFLSWQQNADGARAAELIKEAGKAHKKKNKVARGQYGHKIRIKEQRVEGISAVSQQVGRKFEARSEILMNVSDKFTKTNHRMFFTAGSGSDAYTKGLTALAKGSQDMIGKVNQRVKLRK